MMEHQSLPIAAGHHGEELLLVVDPTGQSLSLRLTRALGGQLDLDLCPFIDAERILMDFRNTSDTVSIRTISRGRLVIMLKGEPETYVVDPTEVKGQLTQLNDLVVLA